MNAREFRLGDKVYCTKRKLNGTIEDYKSSLFTILFENGSYGRYKPALVNSDRFLLVEDKPKYHNVIYVDFKNKRVG